MKINLSPWHFDELAKKGYTLDQLAVLSWINEEVDIEKSIDFAETKVNAIFQSLSRKGLIVSTDMFRLTKDGEELIAFANAKAPRKIKKKEVLSTEFNEWWDIFPRTDTFNHKGRQFTGCRGLRVSKDRCRLQFQNIIREKNFTPTQIIEATKIDVLAKKDMSVKTNNNQLKFLQNSLTYLNKTSFESFVADIGVEKEKIVGTTDI